VHLAEIMFHVSHKSGDARAAELLCLVGMRDVLGKKLNSSYGFCGLQHDDGTISIYKSKDSIFSPFCRI